MTSTLISDKIILTATNSKTKKLSSKTIKKHTTTAISKGSTTITCNHQNNRSKYIVIHGILISGQYYSNPLIIPDIHTFIRIQIFTIIWNMVHCMNHNFHTYVIKSFVKSGKNLLPGRMQNYILHSKRYLEAGSRWLHLLKLWSNMILSIPYTFGMPLIIFYGTSSLSILVINTSTTATNILVDSQISSTLLLYYFINAPLESKIICQKLHLAMEPLVLTHNHINVSWLIFTSLRWPLTTVTKRLYMKESDRI